ncbi:MAG TPA: hypothetical protein EYN91_17425, partial [Candidatus Melainabacteria bacterium]|nr:hypothetical protein [Candidatus Melainabacteria bacterium]
MNVKRVERFSKHPVVSMPNCTAGLFGFLLFFAVQTASAAPSDMGWVIEQKSEERGRTLIRMTEDSMVLTSKLMSAILTS